MTTTGNNQFTANDLERCPSGTHLACPEAFMDDIHFNTFLRASGANGLGIGKNVFGINYLNPVIHLPYSIATGQTLFINAETRGTADATKRIVDGRAPLCIGGVVSGVTLFADATGANRPIRITVRNANMAPRLTSGAATITANRVLCIHSDIRITTA